MADAHSLLSFLGSTLDQPSSLPQTLSLLSLHAPFHPDVFHTVPAHSTTSFLKALDGLILSKDESNRLMGWSIGAVVIEQSRGSFEILDKYGRNWVVGLMSIVGVRTPRFFSPIFFLIVSVCVVRNNSPTTSFDLLSISFPPSFSLPRSPTLNSIEKPPFPIFRSTLSTFWHGRKRRRLLSP